MKQKTQKILFKMMLVGDAQVGKTQICNRFVHNQFSEKKYKATTHSDFLTKEIEQGDKTYLVQLWDTPGENFSGLDENLMKGSDVIGIVLDGTKSAEDQKKSMTKWFEKCKKLDTKPLIYFMVNKTDHVDFRGELDCTNVITEWNNEKKAIGAGWSHMDVPGLFFSALSGDGINAAFAKVVGDFDEKRKLRGEGESEEESQNELNNNSGSNSFAENTPWENFKARFAKHKIWMGGNAFFIVVLIGLLVAAAATPFGSMIAFGALSGVAVAGIMGGGTWLLWNIGCAIRNIFIHLVNSNKPPSTSNEDAASDNKNFYIYTPVLNTKGEVSFGAQLPPRLSIQECFDFLKQQGHQVEQANLIKTTKTLHLTEVKSRENFDIVYQAADYSNEGEMLKFGPGVSCYWIVERYVNEKNPLSFEAFSQARDAWAAKQATKVADPAAFKGVYAKGQAVQEGGAPGPANQAAPGSDKTGNSKKPG